ncbi:MAG: lysophospholipid acyltransferase family protein [Acetobacteraceae bacterium]
MILLRSAVYNVYFWTITLIMAVASLPIRWFAPHLALSYGKIWARALFAGLGPLAGIRIHVTGMEHLPKRGPALIASQHQSAFDTLVWLKLAPRPAYVLKSELARIPLFGPMLGPSRQIAIDRSGGAATIRKMLRDAKAAAAEDRQIIIFPEGTRRPPGDVGRLQPGVAALAAHTGLGVIPVVTDSGRCWPRRSFRKQSGTIRIAILLPLAPDLPRAALLARLTELYRAGVPAPDKPLREPQDIVSARPDRA